MAAHAAMKARSAARAARAARTASRGLAVVVATCLALAGCSSSDPEASQSYNVTVPAAGDVGDEEGVGSLPDPCSLLTPAKIATASGMDFAEGYFNDDLSTDTQSICEWLPTDATFPLVQVYVSGGADQVSTQRATAESMFGTGVDVTVPGAKDAYAVAKGSVLGMAVGDYFVQVSYMTTDGTDVLPVTSALAAQAAASL